MLSTYFNITIIAEWITFIAAIFFLNKRAKLWQLFILLLFATLIAETAGWHIRTHLHQYNNAFPFNLLMLLSTSFFIWFFTKAKSLQKAGRTIIYSMCFFIIFGLINLFFFQGFKDYNSYSETLGDIIVSVICCYFFYTLLTDNEYINLLHFDYFWLATGLLFYSLGSALLYQFSGALKEFFDSSHIDIGTYINYALNLILYTSLIIAFICRWRTTR